MSDPKPPKATYEEKLAELEAIMEWFDSDAVTLDASMKQFERGMKLAEELEKELRSAENRVEQIKQKFTKANG
ncbi:MAG TPA: exodeoxyribonuclease VII small subunit [Candidatus Saccharimonadales bacterium]|nr:exodeoxyribonuclease VII small subunit [Candidatus Saccharimonadales bacterium]